MHGSDRLQAALERLDLIEYADIFRKEEIDDGNLHLLTEAHLRGSASRWDLRYRSWMR